MTERKLRILDYTTSDEIGKAELKFSNQMNNLVKSHFPLDQPRRFSILTNFKFGPRPSLVADKYKENIELIYDFLSDYEIE